MLSDFYLYLKFNLLLNQEMRRLQIENWKARGKRNKTMVVKIYQQITP